MNIPMMNANRYQRIRPRFGIGEIPHDKNADLREERIKQTLGNAKQLPEHIGRDGNPSPKQTETRQTLAKNFQDAVFNGSSAVLVALACVSGFSGYRINADTNTIQDRTYARSN